MARNSNRKRAGDSNPPDRKSGKSHPQTSPPQPDGMRKSGLSVVGDVTWGSHFCQFYQTQEDLLDILVPYFQAGLEANEFCMWVTSEPLSAEEAKAALGAVVPDLKKRIARGQMEILDYRQWYVLDGKFSSDRVLQGWVDKLEAALRRGFEGLRLTGNTFWLEKSLWKSFSDYEAAVDGIIGKYRMLALCTYSLSKCNALEVIDVVQNHQFALIRRGKKWERLQSMQRAAVEAALREANDHLRTQSEQLQAVNEELDAQAEELAAQTEELRTANEELAAQTEELRRSERQWRKSERLARQRLVEIETIYNSAHVGLCVFDRDLRYVRINERLAKINGIAPAEHIGKTVREVIPDLADTAETLAAKIFRTGEPVLNMEFSGKTPAQPDVQRYWIEHWLPLKDEAGEVVGINVVIEEITERKETENRLAYLASFPLRNPRPVMEVDLDGDIRYMNPAAMHLFPDLGEQGLEHPWLADWATVVRPFHEGQIDVGLRDLNMGGRTYQQAFYYSAQEGFVRIYGFDITERKQAEQALQEANERLQVQTEELRAANEELQAQGEELQSQAEELRQAEQALRQMNEELEDRVAARTRDLSKANEALRQAGAYTRSLIEASLDPLVTIGPDGRITDVNAATEAVTGRARKKLIGTDFSNYFTDPAKAQAGYQQVFQEGFVRDYPLEIRHKTGRLTDVLYNASVYKDANGEVVGVFAAARDVTEQRRAEQMRARLAAIVESSDDAIIGKDLTGKITSWNKGAQRIYGYTAEEVLGQPVSLLTPGESQEEIERIFARLHQNETVEHYETVRTTKDGRPIHVSLTVSPIRDAAGRVVGASTVARDITERKRAEEAVRRAGAYNRSLIEASLDPLVTIGPDGKITDVNAATEAVTGYTRKRLIGTDFSDYFTDPAKAQAGYQQVFQEGFVRDYPLEIRHKNGRVTEVLYNATVYRDEAGDTVGVFAAARDVTERRRAEQAVKAERQRFNDVLETLPAYLVLLTPDYHVPFANRFFRERFGESHGQRCFEYLFGRNEPCEVCDTYKVLKTNAPHRWEWTGPDGHNYDVYDFPFTDTDGSPLIMEMGIDITERKRAENALREANETLEQHVAERTKALQEANERLQAQAEELRAANEELQAQSEELQMQSEELTAANEELREHEQALRQSEQRYRTVADFTDDWGFWLRPDGQFEYISPSMQRIVGRPVEPDGRAVDLLRQVVHPEDLDQRLDHLRDEQAGVGPCEMEFRIVRPDGEVRWVHHLCQPVHDAQGRFLGTRGSNRDITDRKKAEQRLAQENHEISLANRVLQVFVEETGDDLFDKALQIVLEGMESRHGVFGYIDENGDLVCPSMSKLLDECEMANKCIRYPQGKWKGLWSRALRKKKTLYTNKPPVVPKGHVPIRNNLAAPILFQGRVIGLLNLANKETEYTEADCKLIESIANRVAPVLYAWVQKELRENEREAAEEALRQAHQALQTQSEELAATNEELQAQGEEFQVTNEELREQGQALQESLETQRRTAERLKLLSDTAASLLAAENPQIVIESLCQTVMRFLDCQVSFNFLVDERAGRLRLNACAGIPKKERKKVEWLDFGVVVCGCVARDAQRIVVEHISESNDERTALVKSYGIKAYACHPIMADSKVLGTLAFGTKTRETFCEDELSLMKTVTDLVAIAVQRQQVQRALRDSEQRYRNLFERMNEGFGLHEIVCDSKGQPCDYRFLDVNPAFEQLTGLKRENVVGRLVSEVIPNIEPHWLQTYSQVALTGEPVHLERYSTELQRHYDAYAYRPAPGQFAVMFMDATQRKQMEAQLRQLNEQLEEKIFQRTGQLTTTVDRLQDEVARRVLAEGKLRKHSQMLEGFFHHTITPLAFLDRRFNFLRVNEAYAEAGKKDPQYFAGKNHFELYPHEENRAIFEQVVRTKQPYRAFARPFTYPDDPQRVTYWNWLLTPLLDSAGEVQSLVLNLEDVTEQQTAYQELEQRTRQLQHLAMELSQAEDRERRRLAEILHDDLQQILAAAKFHLGILNGRVKGDESVRELTSQLNQMLKEAIDKSRSLSHELSPAVLYQGDLGETFEWLAQQLQTKHGLTVHVETRGPADSPSEPLKAFLYRTAQEMLFNAVKHAKVHEARLRIKRSRGELWLTISDRGKGFDPKTLSRAAGYGLLSIRERVELLGGRMKIRSVIGRGSTFLIAVPDPQELEAAATGAITDPRARLTKRERAEQKGPDRLRVLLVDDHKVMREGLASLLDEQPDMEVVGQAGNGREAVDLAYKLEPHVVIMDSSMPVMPGDEATRQIKLHLSKVRVIALSMFDEPQVSRRMRRAGAEMYLLKTAPSEELLAAIRGTRPGEQDR